MRSLLGIWLKLASANSLQMQKLPGSHLFTRKD
ncbi:hypothetical protein [Klebsiella phage Kpn74]|uniref:Uncharacterized protein n=1 Tax=Klebsiella phage Kpn74 TaxID=3044026 RepID=A0AAT9V5B5_9CAUD|nr:hypothetical protein [Klebsiella phage Kpn74]